MCDLWELFDNGSAVVGSETRRIALRKLLRESEQLPCSAGVLNMLNNCSLQAAAYLRNCNKGELSYRHRAESAGNPWNKREENGYVTVRSQADTNAEEEYRDTYGDGA